MAIWPFSRAKPGGYVDTVDVPTAAELNKIDIQAAQAADGVVWTDAAVAKNWPYKSAALTNRGKAVVWTGSRWLTIGLNGTTPECSYGLDGSVWISIGSMGAGVGLASINGAAAASNGSGLVVVGGTPSSASATKYRQSSDHGATWAVRNSPDSSAAGVTAIAWFPAAGLFVSAMGTTIETSPDGVTWTTRSSPNIPGAFAVSPTAIICGRNRSTDGINWTSLAAQFNTDYYGFAYSTALARFVAFGFNAVNLVKASVDDGVTWSASGLTPPPGGVSGSLVKVSSYGRVILTGTAGGTGGGLYYSIDGSVSWKQAFLEEANGVAQQPVIGNGQFLYAEAFSTVHRGSFIAGS